MRCPGLGVCESVSRLSAGRFPETKEAEAWRTKSSRRTSTTSRARQPLRSALSDFACSRASDLEVIDDDGSLTVGLLRIVVQCESYDEGCYRPGSEQDLVDDPRFQRLAPRDRLVLLIGYLRYANLDREIRRPTTFVGNPFRNGKTLDGVAAWSHDARVPPSAVRSAIAAGLRAGLLEQRKERAVPREPLEDDGTVVVLCVAEILTLEDLKSSLPKM
jgi:hypothetical protein